MKAYLFKIFARQRSLHLCACLISWWKHATQHATQKIPRSVEYALTAVENRKIKTEQWASENLPASRPQRTRGFYIWKQCLEAANMVSNQWKWLAIDIYKPWRSSSGLSKMKAGPITYAVTKQNSEDWSEYYVFPRLRLVDTNQSEIEKSFSRNKRKNFTNIRGQNAGRSPSNYESCFRPAEERCHRPRK